MTSDISAETPQHVAIIMDGNNRWAQARGMASKLGHRAGAEAARDIVNVCLQLPIKYLTLFAFSSENWLRPKREVTGLMSLFMGVLKRKEVRQLHRNNVRIRFIGNRSNFSDGLQKSMKDVEALTEKNTGISIIVAADYGGHWDITNAVRSIAREVESGHLKAADVDVSKVAEHVCLSECPPPDLCIRTGGEYRISNFLLWQFAYTELYFTDCLWPDFDESEFMTALADYASRQRRYGIHSEAEIGDDSADSERA